MIEDKKILLIISGGIAAYKAPDLVRRLRERNAQVHCLLTQSGAQFVTPLALGAVSGEKVHEELFDLTSDNGMGHIALTRKADLIVIAPATAHLLARMALGLADDLATTALLAARGPIIAAPAMNPMMWKSDATQANINLLTRRGVRFLGPELGDTACGEDGQGRMADPIQIADAVEAFFTRGQRLAGRRVLVTSGPTHEPIDPVRYIANRSSGKQGHAIAQAFAEMGAETILVSGPTQQADPTGAKTIHVESARDMLAACKDALPADVAICAAAVADWRVQTPATSKIKKSADENPPILGLVRNPDILAAISKPGAQRPRLVVGFAAETEDVAQGGRFKLQAKGCDWIVANNVSSGYDVFGGDHNQVCLITKKGQEDWPKLGKRQVAERLANRIADALKETT